MVGTVKKNKTKASSASGRAKVKTKTTRAVVKTKKPIAKAAKIKKAKPATTKAPIKKVVTKTKVKAKAKAPIKKPPVKTKAKAQIKVPAKVQTKTTVAVKPKEKIIRAEHVDSPAIQQPLVVTTVPEQIVKHITQPTENYMDEEQLFKFKNMLEQWKKELMQEVDNTLTEMKGAGVQADPNDCATQEETFSLELRTRDRERKLLKKIEETLQKIEDKEYGYCDTCGIEIGIRRLTARPTANLCIDCKTLDEIKEKRS